MQIIDSHQHFWKYNPHDYDWISDQMDILKQDYLPEDLESVFASTGVSGCVSVQASGTLKETEDLLRYSNLHPSILGVVGWVDLCSEDCISDIQKFSIHPKFKGVRYNLQNEAVDFMERQDFINGISQLRNYDLAYDLLVYSRHLPNALALVKKFPDQRFVIDHIAKPLIKIQNFHDWKDYLKQFKEQKHVVCKLSGMVTEADWKNWGYKSFVPVLDVVSEIFGPDRLMFGSDWPVCLLAASYKNVLDIIKTYTDDWSEDDKNKIFWKNAAQFYKLEPSWI